METHERDMRVLAANEPEAFNEAFDISSKSSNDGSYFNLSPKLV
jgi:hypothetical protein